MSRASARVPSSLAGRVVVITRPAGTAGALARQVRALGGEPLSLPGLSLRGAEDVRGATTALRAALRDEVLVFTSPAAVRFAAQLAPLRTRATVLAVGQGTARALRRHGIAAIAPRRQDSEGLLEQPALQDLRGRRVALIGAPGGRGLLREQFAVRGAELRELHVYRRVAPRLLRRHVDAVAALPRSARVLLSSVEALDNLRALLPPAVWSRLCTATAIASSERLAAAARAAGFARVRIAASAMAADLLAAAARR
ncbi:uroporphyrinogen-III synthase [Dyella sp. LX-66]|uniref:uroporphyrinogen-III synthase n=1 Tax=unclassified Dyella TaxID=2634549 RepID=UPI001BDFFD79|nr:MULTISPECIES: uroporphyrinogen-III synthase [unclassified Dyella]MBT2116361.1 uroporphyrinogen-III synthase [Dyella sp. LX-1]MBT2140696.1 uroporphyrinogen-III synthase [Dyella sp. LX-66]